MPTTATDSYVPTVSRKKWEGQEAYDALHLEEEDFLEKYEDRNADSLRLFKKRQFEQNKEPVDGYVGLRMAYFDIETSDLKADFGTVLCASVADGFGNVKTFRRDEFQQEHLLDDKQLLIALRDYLESDFDIVVTWYGKIFDVPFVNTRLTVEHGEKPLDLRMHLDAFYLIPQGTMGRSLDNVSRALRVQDGDVHKTKFDKRIWALANAGDNDALNFIVDHCEKDVLLLRRTFEGLRPNVKNIHR